MIKILPILIAFLVGFTACTDRPRVVQTPMGQVLELPNVECPMLDHTGGCTLFLYAAVLYPASDKDAYTHEYEHVFGMRHGPWVAMGDRNCANVTASGNTKWHVGDLLCRMSDGTYQKG